MGEQFIDLFTAGAYALVGRIYGALGAASYAWIFLSLATLGCLFAIMESALEQRPGFWLRHLAMVSLAAVLTVLPQSVDIRSLTYGAPGVLESALGTQSGAAPHLTYWIERLGAHASVALKSVLHSQPVLIIPGAAGQVDAMASDPALLRDPQVRANLDIWRRRVVPAMLDANPELAVRLRNSPLLAALLTPRPQVSAVTGAVPTDSAAQVRALLDQSPSDLSALVRGQLPLINQTTQAAGADAWQSSAGPDASISLRFAALDTMDLPMKPGLTSNSYNDALARSDRITDGLRAGLPDATSRTEVRTLGDLYDRLGRSILYAGGTAISRDNAARAALGSLCQRTSDAACTAALSPLFESAGQVRVPDPDDYNGNSWKTWLQQPLASLLLAITSLLLGALSSLVVSVLPFALGIAKAMAILISVIGTWLLLWPGRGRIALLWMVGPISFVSLWSVLFNLWAEIEPVLMQIASAVSGSEGGSLSASRAMSIAISLGYLGLPSLALGIVYGETGRALYHASARMENALLTAWHTRGTLAAMGRRWVVNSPMARRWNQRAYKAVGLGALPRRTPRPAAPSRTKSTSAGK